MSWRRGRRPKSAVSLQELADLTQFYMDYLASLHRGERNPTMWTLVRLAAALKLGIADIVPPPPPGLRPGQVTYCPGCDLAEITILEAYENDRPCPYCGLPAATIQDVLSARQRAVGPNE